MVKGISRQVIVVHSPDQKLFDQAIFILKGDTATKKAGFSDKNIAAEAQEIIDRHIRQVERLKGEYGGMPKTKKAVRVWPLLLLLVSLASVLAGAIVFFNLL